VLGVTTGLLLTAFGFGLRHGVDWDHIAAIADLSGSAASRRRGFVLSTIYAVGHAIVVLALGVLAISIGVAIPDGVDVWMSRIVGLTLVLLGGWILIDLVRSGSEFRLRSRWILVLNGTFAGLRRVRDARSKRVIELRHDHSHDHEDMPETAHDEPWTHDHAHQESALVDLTEPATVGSGGGGSRWARPRHDHRHRASRIHHHGHQHELRLADDATSGVGNGAAAGIGMLHGIGVESPTQIAVFVASTAVVGWAAGFALLVAWCVGLILANMVLALLAGTGLLHAERNFAVYVAIAVLVAISSIAMGALLIAGLDVLPEINL